MGQITQGVQAVITASAEQTRQELKAMEQRHRQELAGLEARLSAKIEALSEGNRGRPQHRK